MPPGNEAEGRQTGVDPEVRAERTLGRFYKTQKELNPFEDSYVSQARGW